MSKRGDDWKELAEKVHDHIEGYTVPQYGDKGEDQASEFTSHDHVIQAKKYLNRYGKNTRPGQEVLDLIKTAHYCQMAAMELTKELRPRTCSNCSYNACGLAPCIECYDFCNWKEESSNATPLS
jgi:hypothetical protein